MNKNTINNFTAKTNFPSHKIKKNTTLNPNIGEKTDIIIIIIKIKCFTYNLLLKEKL